jgi:hypothetical protein
MAKNSSPASGKMKVRIPSRNHAVAGTGAGDGGVAATLAAGGGRLPSCFVEKIACDVAATPSSPERCGDFDCDEASQPPSRHLFYRAASQPAGAAASSRRMVGELAASCRLHWQPGWLPPPFQTGSKPEPCSWFGERARPGRSGSRPRGPHLTLGTDPPLGAFRCICVRREGAPNDSRGGCAPQKFNCITPA